MHCDLWHELIFVKHYLAIKKSSCCVIAENATKLKFSFIFAMHL